MEYLRPLGDWTSRRPLWSPLTRLCVGAAGRCQRVPTLRPGREAAVTPGVPFPGSRTRSPAPPGPPLLSRSRSGAWERSCSPERRAEAPRRCAPTTRAGSQGWSEEPTTVPGPPGDPPHAAPAPSSSLRSLSLTWCLPTPPGHNCGSPAAPAHDSQIHTAETGANLSVRDQQEVGRSLWVRLLDLQPLRCFNLGPRPLALIGVLAAKKGYYKDANIPHQGQILSITDLPTPMPPPYPRSPVTARRQAEYLGKRGREDANPLPPTPAGPAWAGKPPCFGRTSPFWAREAGPPTKQRYPTPPPRTPAFPAPLSRTQANSEAAPATSGALLYPPMSSSRGESGSLGQPGRVQPRHEEPASLTETTHHGVCSRRRGGSPHSEARPKGPRRRLQRRQRNRTAAAVKSWSERCDLSRSDCHHLAPNGESSRRRLVAASSFQPINGRGGNSDAPQYCSAPGSPAPAPVTRL